MMEEEEKNDKLAELKQRFEANKKIMIVFIVIVVTVSTLIAFGFRACFPCTFDPEDKFCIGVSIENLDLSSVCGFNGSSTDCENTTGEDPDPRACYGVLK